MRIQFLGIPYEFEEYCLLPQNHCEGLGFVLKVRVKVFWEAELLLRAKFTFCKGLAKLQRNVL